MLQYQAQYFSIFLLTFFIVSKGTPSLKVMQKWEKWLIHWGVLPPVWHLWDFSWNICPELSLSDSDTMEWVQHSQDDEGSEAQNMDLFYLKKTWAWKHLHLAALVPVLQLSKCVFLIKPVGSCLAMSYFSIHSSILPIKRNVTSRRKSSSYILRASTQNSKTFLY